MGMIRDETLEPTAARRLCDGRCHAYTGSHADCLSICTYSGGHRGQCRCEKHRTAVTPPPSADSVDHPPHYNHAPMECIDALRLVLTPDEFRGFLLGNAIKYRWRADHKGKRDEDLAKAEWYLERLAQDARREAREDERAAQGPVKAQLVRGLREVARAFCGCSAIARDALSRAGEPPCGTCGEVECQHCQREIDRAMGVRRG